MTREKYNELYDKYGKERNIPKLLALIEDRTMELVSSMQTCEFSSADAVCIIAAHEILNKIYKSHATSKGLINLSNLIVDILMKEVHTECISFPRGDINENKA